MAKKTFQEITEEEKQSLEEHGYKYIFHEEDDLVLEEYK